MMSNKDVEVGWLEIVGYVDYFPSLVREGILGMSRDLPQAPPDGRTLKFISETTWPFAQLRNNRVR